MPKTGRASKAAIVCLFAALSLASCARDPQKAKLKYFDAGQSYMTKEQYGDAAIEFRNALRIDPNFVDAYDQLAKAYMALHQWSAAYGFLQKAIELDPNRISDRLERGRLYVAAHQFDKAEQDGKAVVERDSKDARGYELLGMALMKEGKAEQSLAAFSKAAELSPDSAENYMNVAQVEAILGRGDAAETSFKKAVQVEPGSVPARIDLARFYRLQNKLPEAEQVLQAGIQANPEASEFYLEWAGMLAGQGKNIDTDAILGRLQGEKPKSVETAIAIGDYYSARHQNYKAIAEYSRGLSLAPDNLDINKRMEDHYLTSKQLEQAAQIDAKLVKAAPKDVIVRTNHARLLMAQGKGQDAQTDLLKTVKDVPDSWQARYYLGICYWQNGSLGQAASELQEALLASPGSEIVLQSLVQLKLSQRDTKAAQAYGEELVQKNSTDASNRLLLGGILLREGQARSAEEQFLAAKGLEPNNNGVHAALGQLYFAEKKSDEAGKEFETAVQLDPSNLTQLNEYVSFLLGRHETAKAIAQVQQFLDSHSGDSQGHQLLGLTQFSVKNYAAATAELKRAIELDAKNQSAVLQLGAIYEATGQLDLAIGQYKKALDLKSNVAQISTSIGNLYLQQGDLARAREFFQRAFDANPDPAASSNLAWIDAVENKDLDLALGMAQKAKSEMPNVPAITDTLAWVLYKRGNYGSAIPLLQECVQKSPDNAVFHYHLGMTLLAVGQKIKGREQLDTALRMKLDSADASDVQRTLAQLQAN